MSNDKDQHNEDQNSGVNFVIALLSFCGIGYAIYVLLSL